MFNLVLTSIFNNIGENEDFMSKSISELIEERKKGGEGRVTLSVEQLIEFQNRVRHFLNSYEVENKLNASEMAKILGYTAMHYSRFKLVGTFNKVASCLLFLSNFAQIRNMTLTEFLMNIENKPLKNPEGQLSRGMWDWEIEAIELLGKVDSTVRRIFTRKTMKEAQKNEDELYKFEIALSAMILLMQLNEHDLNLSINIIKDLSSRTYYKNSQTKIDYTNELPELRRNIIKTIKNECNIE